MSGPGPFSTEKEAREWVRLVLAPAAYADSISEGNGALLERAVKSAGLTLGTYDVHILRWLAGHETAACAVVAALIWRAADGIPPGWALTITQALADAIAFREARGGAQDGERAGLYRTVATRTGLTLPGGEGQ